MSKHLSDKAQSPAPIAVLHGQDIKTLPKNVYIPPSALKVLVTDFEGPLDLLLHFVRRANISILDLNLRELTEQYLAYVDMMKELQVEIASEYLVMAATLTEYKSRMLMPRQQVLEQDEEDPRTELARRLVEYEQTKAAAAVLDLIPRMDRDTHQAHAYRSVPKKDKALPEINMQQLFLAAKRVIKKIEQKEFHGVLVKRLSVPERIEIFMAQLRASKDFITFNKLCDKLNGRSGVVVSVVALTEMLKNRLIEVIQLTTYGEIRVRARPAPVKDTRS